MKLTALAMVGALILGGCASTTPKGPSPAARAELAPNGKLRAGINYGNAVLAHKDSMTGELRGVAVSLANELGKRLGDVPVTLVGYDSAAKLVEGFKAGELDVAFLALDPARAAEMSFSPPYMEVEVTYAVPAKSKMEKVTDVDRENIRIAVAEKNAADLFLSRNLKEATLLRAPTTAAAIGRLTMGAADAFAGNRQEIESLIDTHPRFRLVEGRFTTIPHAIAVPVDRKAAAAYLPVFVEDAKRLGIVQDALAGNGVRGVIVPIPVQ